MGPNGLHYAGGGAAGTYGGTAPGRAGYGGGGRGYDPLSDDLTKGKDNLGGGGGGRHPASRSVVTNGGKGIVMVRYAI